MPCVERNVNLKQDVVTSRKTHRTALRPFIIGAFCLITTCVIATSNHLSFWWDEHQYVFTRNNYPFLFQASLILAGGIAGFAFAIAIVRFVSRNSDAALEPRSSRKPKGRRIWMIFNAVIILLSVWTGFQEVGSTQLQQMNPDAIACILILVIMPIFTIGTLSLSKNDTFTRPSWSRPPSNWRRDPFQALFLATWCCLGLFVGAVFRIACIGGVGFWVVAAFGSMFLGLLIGQLLAFCIYRSRIIDEN